MKVEKTVNNGIMTVKVDGEVNTLTAPELAKYVEELSGVKKLIFDAEGIPYISSAGLRLFMTCLRTMKASGGEMVIRRCNEFVVEIFESVGYDRIMTLE